MLRPLEQLTLVVWKHSEFLILMLKQLIDLKSIFGHLVLNNVEKTLL